MMRSWTIRLCCGMCLSLMLMAHVCPSLLEAGQESDAYHLNQRGIDALEAERYEQAILFFKEALSILPDHATLNENLALALNGYAMSLKETHVDDAIRIQNEAISRFPKRSDFLDNLADLYNAKARDLTRNAFYEDALVYLQKAHQLAPRNSLYKTQISKVYVKIGMNDFNDKRYSQAHKNFKKALQWQEDNTRALYYLGEIHYYQQKMEDAERYWQEVLRYDPYNNAVRLRLDNLAREMSVENSLSKTGVDYFDIRYERYSEKYNIYDVKNVLREVRKEVGRDFNFFPKHKTVVILYPEDDFQKIREHPHWVAAIYDGKIRLPMNPNISPQYLKELIYHEYTHVVIGEVTNGQCPIWLNEGLARYQEFQGRAYEGEMLRLAVQQDKLLNLASFSSTQFNFSLPTEQVALFYDQAYSFVSFLVKRFRMYKIRRLCEDLGSGMSIEEALQSQFRMNLQQLQQAWVKNLRIVF